MNEWEIGAFHSISSSWIFELKEIGHLCRNTTKNFWAFLKDLVLAMTLSILCNFINVFDIFFPMDKYVIITKFSFNFDGIPVSIYLLSNYVSDTMLATGT